MRKTGGNTGKCYICGKRCIGRVHPQCRKARNSTRKAARSEKRAWRRTAAQITATGLPPRGGEGDTPEQEAEIERAYKTSPVQYCEAGTLGPWGKPDAGWYVLCEDGDEPAPRGPYATEADACSARDKDIE